MKPSISAIVTSYDHERTVRRAVESALAQDVPGLEVIVVDDASTDGSREVLEGLRGDPRLRLELHGTNRGVSRTFQHGLELARGEWVAYLGSDDFWHPGHLSGACAALAGTDAAFCYGRVALVDADDRDVTAEDPLFDEAPVADFLEAILLRSNFVPFISVVMRRELALAVGGFDARLAALQDYDLWIRLAARGDVLFRDEVTASFRWGGENASRRSLENSVRFREDLVIVLEKTLHDHAALLERRGLAAGVRRRLAGTYARLARRQEDPAAKAKSYGRSLRHDPFHPGVAWSWLAARLRAGLGSGLDSA